MCCCPNAVGRLEAVHGHATYAVFLCLWSSSCRKTALPLVNKRWARLLREPSRAWRDVVVGCSSLGDDDDDDEERVEKQLARRQQTDQLQNAQTALSWFTRRRG